MPRAPRISLGNTVYHVLNRAQGKHTIFKHNLDYLAFESLLVETVAETQMRLLAYCLMPNHWHMLLYPRNDGDLPKFVHLLSLTHAKRWHANRGTTGTGHLYQDRYKSFPVLTDEYFLQVYRYVERNALRAQLVKKAEDWRWSSAWNRKHTTNISLLLDKGPVNLPDNYLGWLNMPQEHEELKKIRSNIIRRRGRPKKVPGVFYK